MTYVQLAFVDSAGCLITGYESLARALTRWTGLRRSRRDRLHAVSDDNNPVLDPVANLGGTEILTSCQLETGVRHSPARQGATLPANRSAQSCAGVRFDARVGA